MIENLLKVKPGTFGYATVTAVDPALGKVQVELGVNNLRVWIQTSLTFSIGDAVIVARNDQDKSKLIIQHSSRSVPSQGTLVLVE